MTRTFRERMASAASEKKSRIVLALDPPSDVVDPQDFAEKIIHSVQKHISAIKINFHLILPLSGSEIARINQLAHSYGLQSIADVKLNDIDNTNKVAVDNLAGKMGFDALIANPFIGKAELTSLVNKARRADAGVIALVYMSHPGAKEGFGLDISRGRTKSKLYKIFLDRACFAHVDGIVIGATQLKVLKQVAKENPEMPVYSPGVGAQRGEAKHAIRSGASYLIIGRSILQSSNPAEAAKAFQLAASVPVRD